MGSSPGDLHAKVSRASTALARISHQILLHGAGIRDICKDYMTLHRVGGPTPCRHSATPTASVSTTMADVR